MTGTFWQIKHKLSQAGEEVTTEEMNNRGDISAKANIAIISLSGRTPACKTPDVA